MSIEGSLQIRLKTESDSVEEVSIDSNRPVHACRIFQGKSIVETLKTIPLLFNICGAAQACAGVRAFEQVLGVRVSERIEWAREAVVSMETLREHLWRILLDWPSFVDAVADSAAVAEIAAIQREYRQTICPDGNLFQLGGTDCCSDSDLLDPLLARLTALLQEKVFCMMPERWLDIDEMQTFDEWLAGCSSDAAKFLHKIVMRSWGAAGKCQSDPLPKLDPERLHQVLRNERFVECPQWSGNCYETTSRTRVDSSLLGLLNQQYGNGLLTRQVARLSEIARLPNRLVPDLTTLSDAETRALETCNQGIGQVEAARGRLVHRVEVKGDEVVAYQILAPTEWNFHPWGVVARSLSTLKGDDDAVEQQARLLIDAIDPCVGYELQIVDDG